MKPIYQLHSATRHLQAAACLVLLTLLSPSCLLAKSSERPLKASTGQKDVQELPMSAGSTLQDATIYTFKSPSATIAGTRSALYVAEGATTTIYIAKGCTLTLNGSNGGGREPGYPGIEVHEGSTLIITGEGTLIAQGGNNGDGGASSRGSNGYMSGNNGCTGDGGSGGSGGGGAAPGIGGSGGMGALPNPGAKGFGRARDHGSYDHSGDKGNPCQSGASGTGMGNVYILGNVRVTASVGKANAKGGSCDDTWTTGAKHSQGFANCYTYTADGGGPGGGGGSGYAARHAIGGGAPGGQSGGSGGAGGHMVRTWSTSWLHGGGGQGGDGAAKGTSSTVTSSSYDGKSGGKGGEGTANTAAWGADGKLYVADRSRLTTENSAGVSEREILEATSHQAISFAISFEDEAKGTATAGINAFYGIMPQNITPPSHEGDYFLGFYTDEGVQVYDGYGHARIEWTFNRDMTLQARWSNSHISTREQFERFCLSVNSVDDTQDVVVYLENDLDLSGVTTAIGTSEKPFKGTFEGQFHTLNVSRVVFACVEGATVRNLIVTGDSSPDNCGLILRVAGDDRKTTTLENVEIRSSISYSSLTRTAGFVSTNEAALALHNCAFTGVLRGDVVCGVAAYGNGKLAVDHCLLAMRDYSADGLGYAFTFDNAGVTGSESCCVLKYDNMALANAKSIDQEGDLKDGLTCYLLNGSRTNGAWYQSIGEDRTPTIDISHRKVFCDNGSYCNRNSLKFSKDACFYTGYQPNDKTEIYVDFNAYNVSGSKNYLFTTGLEEGSFAAYIGEDNALHCTGGTGKWSVSPKLTPNNTYTLYISSSTRILDDLPAGNSHLWKETGEKPKTFSEEKSLFVHSCNYIYNLIIMEEGRLIHNFIPGQYHGQPGFYDTVKGEFVPATSTTDVYINAVTCNHRYTTIDRQNGQTSKHCYVCDQRLDTKYYTNVVFEKNADSSKSPVDKYNRVIGKMGEQAIDEADTLKTCLYERPMHIFDGWNTRADGTGTHYDDNCTLTVNTGNCDELHLYAQWLPAYQCNGQALQRIPDGETVSELALKDDGTNGFATAKPFTATKTSYTFRPTKGRHWGTVCLPFAFNAKQRKGMSFYTDATVNSNSTIVLGTPAETVQAGQAAIYYLEEAATGEEITLTAENAKVTASTDMAQDKPFKMIGTYEYEGFKCDDINGAIYYGIMYDKFYYVTSSIVLAPYRAFFYYLLEKDVAEVPQCYDLIFADEEDGLPRTEAGSENTDIWDITGRKVTDTNRHGIYIINGKKITK